MEQPCYKCGQFVEEGRVFCPHCGAPQIRVLVAEPVSVIAVAGQTRIPANETPLRASQTVPVLALPMGWSQTLKPCALAALLSSVMVLLRLYPPVAMLCAGFLAVIFYRQGQPELAIKPGAAFRIGALSGMFFSGYFTLLTALAAMFPEPRVKLHEEILANMQTLVAAHADSPQYQDMLQQIKTPDGFALWLIALGVAFLILSVVLGGLGGTVAGTIFRKKQR
jgi:hypothetical protein